MLFPCPGINVRPSSRVTGANGDPEAKIALPSVYLYASSAVHSALDVGLESAKIIGLQGISTSGIAERLAF